jgi:signal transduction histidine kinase
LQARHESRTFELQFLRQDFANVTSPQEPLDASLLELLDSLYQRQLRQAAAEVAAAIAHAAGTPLNVVSGRAELIRQDPANAAAQVTRIEDQVRKLADGLRQFVDYLTVEDRAGRRDQPAAEVVAELLRLVQPLARSRQVELLTDSAELGAANIDEQSLSNLVALLSWATRSAAAGSRIELRATAASGGALFELKVPGLVPPDVWRLEHFDARAPSEGSERYRVMAICAAVARGQGGKLQAEALTPPGATATAQATTAEPAAGAAASTGIRIRLLCRSVAG